MTLTIDAAFALPAVVLVDEARAALRVAARAKPRRFDFGMLPPRFFAHLRDRLLQTNRRLRRVPRNE